MRRCSNMPIEGLRRSFSVEESRNPEDGTSNARFTLQPVDSVSPQAFPQLVLSVSSLLNLDLE